MTVTEDTSAWRVLQRVVLPSPDQTDTVSLYADAGSANGIRLRENDELARTPKQPEEKLQMFSSGGREAHFADLLGRHSMRVRSGEQVSFGTYFNAFPASYWRRWTSVRDIRLVVKTSGSGNISVYKSNARGSVQRVDGKHVEGSAVSEFELSLKPFGDGGWYWFDLAGSSGELVLDHAEWEGLSQVSGPGQVTLQITTMNKPEFCLNNARILSENLDVLKDVKEILIVDQGTNQVEDQDGFAGIDSALGGKLRVINQANLGGSGGFARGMYESVENGSDYVLLLDDDIVIEPESILRLLTFADHCRKPSIIGGHMFDLYNRSVLHTFGEVVNPHRIVPAQPHADMDVRHDFSIANLRQTAWLHRRVDVDYNGWWMCLIPTKVIREIGLSLPLFIKWDDAEYGLRAREAGYSTVSLPGAAVWHVSWTDKDDLVGWQAYFHARNRMITTLIHSPYKKGGRVLRESVQDDVKHLVSMQYFTEHGRIEALKDVLKGPDVLHASLGSKLPEINALKASYSDAQLRENVDDFPTPKIGRGPIGGAPIGMPSKKELVPWGIRTVAKQLVTTPGAESLERPQGFLAHRDNRWFRLAHYDSVVVSNAEGTGASWYRRDPKKLKAMLTEATGLHMRIFREWERLAEQYREALPELTSLEAWKRTFDANPGAGK
ncbi:glycosyltransferase [Arthrobacter sp. UYEF21]|uniref:glycosyltransferase n=1 Tax=Arthrobacter sp. UYEF21 TaxID=1756364 RepID=UPI003392F31E